MPTPSAKPFLRRTASAAALALLVLVGAASTWGARMVARGNEQLEHTHRVIERIENAQAAITATEAAGRGYRLTSHPALREEIDILAPRALLAAQALVDATADDPRQLELARQFQARTKVKTADVLRLAELQDREGREAAIRAMNVEEVLTRMRDLEMLGRKMLVEELQVLAERRADTERNNSRLLVFVLVGLGVSLITLWAMLVSLTRESRQNLRMEQETRANLQRLRRSQALTERLSEQRRALSEYTGMLQSAQSLDEAMEVTAGTLERLLPQVGGRCYLTRASRDLLESRAQFGTPAIESSDAFDPSECWGLRRGQPHLDRNGSAAMRCGHVDGTASMEGISSLCIPLTAHGETLGLLHVSASTAADAEESNAEIIGLAAEQLALAIANLRLRETLRQQTLRDPLTGLFNRRYFEESLRREMLRCERRGLPLALLVLDVDHFKAFNDSHGHSAGDAVLANVGHTIQALVRAEDFACRYGGEEFTIVMPEADAASAHARAEALRSAVSHTTVEHHGLALGPVTMSVGIAVYPDDGITPEALFEVGDASLYQAKAEGRNRVVHATRAG